MKFISLFGKPPQYRRFNYTPRFYDALEEERKKREQRIREELKLEQEKQDAHAEPVYTSKIAGSFRSARRTASRQADPSANIIRLVILTFLSLLLIAYFQFGNVALYGLALIIPVYVYFRFRGIKRNT